MKQIIIAAALLISTGAAAHELTPTYPKLIPSFVDGVLVTKMKMWNRRKDAEYYEIDVYDEEWNPISFASVDKIFRMQYLEKRNIEIFIRESDKDRVEFICTTSKQLKQDVKSTGVKSRICSRVK